MVGDPGDRWAYRIAVGALGLAALTALIGAIVIVALQGGASTTKSEITVKLNDQLGAKHGTATSTTLSIGSTRPSVTLESGKKTTTISSTPTGLYVLGGALAGALLGILIPLPWSRRLLGTSGLREKGSSGLREKGSSDIDWGKLLAESIPILLLLVFGGLLVGGVIAGGISGDILGATIGGAALGLCVPSPA